MKVEIRADKSRMTIEGYVNVPGRNSRVIRGRRGPFIEQIVPGAFARALQRGDPVGLMFNHVQVLGSTDNPDELRLHEDNIGLYARAEVTDPKVIDDAVNKRLRGWSFGFIPISDKWDDEEPQHRSVEELELREVSILTKTPAYIATSIEARADEEVTIEYRMEDFEDDDITVLAEEKRAEENDPPADNPFELMKKKLELEKVRL